MTDFIQCRTKKYKFRSWAALMPFGAALPIIDTDDPGLRFPGQWAEGETGLLQNWHRDYDPSLGRYIEADPLGLDAGQSLYGYVGQDPLGAIDPEGLFYTDIVIQYLKLKRAKKIADEETKSAIESNGGKVPHNDFGNAMRHAKFSKRVAEEEGKLTAILAGTGHEVEQFCRGEPWGEIVMDLHNNREGRRAASRKRDINPEKLITRPSPLGENIKRYRRGD